MILSLLIDSICLFRHRYACPFIAFRINQFSGRLAYILNPVIRTPYHDRTHRRHSFCTTSLGLTAVKPAFHRLCHRDCLRHRKTYGGINIHTLIGCFLNRFDSCFCDRYLNLNVRRQSTKVNRLLRDLFCIAVILWVGLHGQTPFLSFVLLERWQQQFCAFACHLFNQLPGDLILCGIRHLPNQLMDSSFP